MPARKVNFSRQILAHEGYFVLDVEHDKSGYPLGAKQFPVIAWAFKEGDDLSIPYPVTVLGVRTEQQFVLNPCGVVRATGAWCGATVASWIEDLQEQHRLEHGRQE